MHKRNGFSMLEMLAAFLGTITAITARLSRQHQNESLKLQALFFAKGGNRYITAHYSLFQNLLSPTGEITENVITIPGETLISEGFLPAPKNKPLKNYLGQIPCLVVTWDGQELNGLLYYRSTDKSRYLSEQRVFSGLNAIGAAAGYYQNGNIYGAARDWRMINVNSIFVAQGLDPTNGENPDAFKCAGTGIAQNSYVINLSYMNRMNNKLPLTDALFTTADDTTEKPDDPKNNNVMLTDLNMDYAPDSEDKNAIIFQNNESCPFDPNDKDHKQMKKCVKQQLGIVAGTDEDGQKVVRITGFVQDPNSKSKSKSDIAYVGQLTAASFQPTLAKLIGDPCTPKLLGSFAKITLDDSGRPIGRDYRGKNFTYPIPISSNLVCQLSVLCPDDTKQDDKHLYCWLPSSTLTYDVNPNLTAPEMYVAPAGFAIVPGSVEYTDVVFTPEMEALVAGRWKDNWWAGPRCTSEECMNMTSGDFNCHEFGHIFFVPWESFGTWQPVTILHEIYIRPDDFYFAIPGQEDQPANRDPNVGYKLTDTGLISAAYGKYRYWWKTWDGIGPTADYHCTHWFWADGRIGRQPLVMTKVRLSNDPLFLSITVPVDGTSQSYKN